MRRRAPELPGAATEALAHLAAPRYARQLALRGFGPEGQARLAAGRVLIVGAGGLGSPAALYLAAAGVGVIGLVDRDAVEESNLHRQLLYGSSDVGHPKLTAARHRLAEVNPMVRVVPHETRLTAANAGALVAGYDLVLDATDNFPTRYAINDACLGAGIPFVYGSVARFEGQVGVFAAPGGPCYRCLFPEPPPAGTVPTCAEEGVLGVVPGVVGLLQATEAIKWLARIGTPLVGELLLLDLLTHDSRRIAMPARPGCPACAGRSSASERPPSFNPTPSPVGAREFHGSPSMDMDVTPATVAQRLEAGEPITIIDVREPWELDIVRLPDAVHIPLGQLPARVGELDPSKTYGLLCHHGGRSARATMFLHQQGFSQAFNIAGGIDAWSHEVDPGLARY